MIINYSLQSLLHYEHFRIDLIDLHVGDVGRELSLVHLWSNNILKQFLYLAEYMGPQDNSQGKVSVCRH